MPRRKVAATNPTMSPTTPPPTATRKSPRSVPTSISQSYMVSTLARFFRSSPPSVASTWTSRPRSRSDRSIGPPNRSQTLRSAITRGRPFSPARSTAGPISAEAPGPTSASYEEAPALIRTARGSETRRASETASELGADELGDDIGNLPWGPLIRLDDVMGGSIVLVAQAAKLGQAPDQVVALQQRARLAAHVAL